MGGILAVVDASGREFDDPDSFPSRDRENVFDKTVRHYWADRSSTVMVPRPLGRELVLGGRRSLGIGWFQIWCIQGLWADCISGELSEAIRR